MENCWGIVLAAGRGLRAVSDAGHNHGQAQRKQFMLLDGQPLFWQAAKKLAGVASLQGLIFTLPNDTAEDLQNARELLNDLEARNSLGLPWLAVPGGRERQDSVRAALDALPRTCSHVLIHDAARPFASTALAANVLTALRDGAPAVVPGIPLADTVKQVDSQERVLATPERSGLRAVQTPQGFAVKLLKEAHALATDKNIRATDDAALMEWQGHEVLVIPGEEENIKITTGKDLKLLSPLPEPGATRVGFGYDVHAYGGERPLVLGGIAIPGAAVPKVKAHSDGDVLLHALMDAILGCMCAGDIGQHFPDSDPNYDNISSALLLAEVMDLAERSGLRVQFVDLTVIAQTPRLSAYRDQIVNNISKMLHLPPNCVNLKATTEEGLGFTGEKKGLKAVACVTAKIKTF